MNFSGKLLFLLLFFSFSMFSSTGQTVFINEIHYDNASTDVNEGIEIAGPAGTDLSCYKVVAYNGGDGSYYNTITLTGQTIDDEGCGYGAVWVSISGLQNGSPDGVALVYDPTLSGCSGGGSVSVIQFLSYEGSFTATAGDANGLTSTDIGVAESSSTPSGESLQLAGAGTSYTDFAWNATTSTASMGSINTGQDFCSTPADVTNESANPNGSGQLNVSWTAPAGCSDEILVVASTSSSFSNTPSGDGTVYTADANFGSGTDLGGGEYVVYKGTGTSFNLLSLTNTTTYCVKIYNRCGTSWSAGVVVCGTPWDYRDTLKIMTYNVLNYPGSTPDRDTAFRKIVLYIQPDVILCNEMVSDAGATNLLNNSLNVFGTTSWAKATFVDGPDSDNMMYYNTNKVSLNSQNQISTDLRDISHWQITWTNVFNTTTTFDLFELHLKASSGSTNENRRLIECQSLSTYIDALPANSNIIVGGDFNFYSNAEPAWTELTANGTQLLNDPIHMEGVWTNNSIYSQIHTQSTRSSTSPGGSGGATGGVDDRFDFLLINDYVEQGLGGVRYIPSSYDNIGNDGNKLNVAIIENLPNTDVPDSIRDCLFAMSDHMPVVMKVQIDRDVVVPLPVTFLSVEAKRNRDIVDVFWSTATEQDADYYEVLRSVDGYNYVKIGEVSASGNSVTVMNYHFIDDDPYFGVAYYKIKEVDYDAGFNLSEIVVVEATDERSVVIYPNPAADYFYITGTGFTEKISLTILNALGQVVKTIQLKPQKQFVKKVSVEDLPKGYYTIGIQSNYYVKTEQLIIAK